MSIAADFSSFRAALIDSPIKVTTDRAGNWSKIPSIKRGLYALECYEKTRLSALAVSMIKELDSLEKIPVKFGRGDDQKELFNEHLDAAKYIKNRMKTFKTSKKMRSQCQLLKQRMAALKYRMEQVNGGLDKGSVSPEDVNELEGLAVEWKKHYKLYQDTSISDSEREKLREASRYPKFSKLVKLDPAIRNQFFRWVIRDNNPVDTFVQFPSTCYRLKAALLSGRIGRFSREFQYVAKEEGRKVFRLPFQVQTADGGLETRQISILDDHRLVTLRGGLQLTIRQAINIFRRKNNETGNLEFMGFSGITNWDSLKLGWLNPETGTHELIDVDHENSRWWEQLPVFETVSAAEVRRRFGVDVMGPGQWLAVAKSTRECLTLDIDRSHGYFEILVPNPAGEGYRLYPMGKFAKEFPKSIIEKFFFVTNTVESRIEYPDENPFYSHRQHASAPFVIENDQGLELMEMIRKDLKAAREGNVVFQFAWENCAWWPQERLENLLGKKEEEEDGRVPNFFVHSLLESRPQVQPLKSIFKFCRILPECLKKITVKIVAFILGSWRGMWVEENGKRVFKSMKNSRFRKECKMYHPALLHHRIQEGLIEGRVTLGHHFLPQKV